MKDKNIENDDRVQAVAKKLKELRVAAGYTSYEKFAFENKLSRMQYWRMEKGTNFTINSLIKILEIHNMGMKEFFASLEGKF